MNKKYNKNLSLKLNIKLAYGNRDVQITYLNTYANSFE